jgi:hypothetical protein
VIARIAEPTSKADSMRVLTDLGANVLSYRTIQRHLAQIGPGGYRDLIATQCFAHAADTGGLGLILYDVTTLYFEAEKETNCVRSATRRNAGVPTRSVAFSGASALSRLRFPRLQSIEPFAPLRRQRPKSGHLPVDRSQFGRLSRSHRYGDGVGADGWRLRLLLTVTGEECLHAWRWSPPRPAELEGLLHRQAHHRVDRLGHVAIG